jgi:2,3-bisphosphoglycerate-dependent phosphoglycerate mutase
VIYFTRHGESVANVADRNGEPRPQDSDRLSDRGWEQAREVGRRLRGEGIEIILASHYKRAQETAQAIGEVLGVPFETDEDLHEVRQSDAYRAASPNYEGTGHVSWMPEHPPEHAEPGAESFSAIVARVTNVQRRLEGRLHDERILCVSHWGFLHFFLGAAIFREAFSPQHLPALYRISHMNTGITLFHHRRDYLIEGVRFDGWALQTWNDQAHL